MCCDCCSSVQRPRVVAADTSFEFLFFYRAKRAAVALLLSGHRKLPFRNTLPFILEGEEEEEKMEEKFLSMGSLNEKINASSAFAVMRD